ncbi:acetolactate synthase isozyme I large subunit [Escherichia coli]|uniref:Acetolactate synthase isozyme I large subunit n=1 Tax=Escherichia coli TaxID=562 RepID=A0A2X1QB30_ECOLX|nr:acetolactate synthase isozyme I large subunit [Escherichia coli]
MLAQLIPLVEAQPRAEWHQLVADLQREFPCPIPKACDPLSHYGLINAVAACVDDNAIITTDVGQHQMWTAQAYPLNRPRQWLTSGGLGTMGFGLPAAIGASLANPDRKVLCFSGDGSLMMNIQEMATASENQLDVKIILMNNEALGWYISNRVCSTSRAFLPPPIRAKSTLCRLPPDSASKPVI